MDGAFDVADDLLEDDELGKIVFMNDDDDDGNLQRDDWQVEPTPGEDDLAQVQINLDLPSSGGMGLVVGLSLSGDTSLVRLWKTPDRSEALSATGVYWMTYQTPPVIYVEALGVGEAFLRATLTDVSGQYSVQPSLMAEDWLHLVFAGTQLDVNYDLDTDDPVDGFMNYRPGYEGATAKLSSGPFRDVTPLAPQRMNVILNGLGTTRGVSRVEGSLSGVSELKGYTGNGDDPGDTWFNTRDDISFSPDEDKKQSDTNTGGAVLAGKSYLRITARDYAATGDLGVIVFDRSGVGRGSMTRQVVKDWDHDSLQDRWEEEEVARFKAQFALSFANNPPVISIFGSGEPSETTNEYADPDGGAPNLDGDGGRNVVAHKAPGDSLTPFQEYRGFVLDGGGFDGNGANGHPGGHKRLSPAYKEYLWEVDTMQGIFHVPLGGTDAVLDVVARDYSDKNRGPGIRVYWVVSDNQTPYQVFGNVETSSDRDDYARTRRHTGLKGEFIHVMFVADHTGSTAIRGQAGDATGVVAIYMEKVWAYCQQFNYDFMTGLRWTLAHETTHALLNEFSAPGFDEREHLIDPDEDGVTPNDPGDEGEVMYRFSTNAQSSGPPLWLPATIRRLDLTSKEGVER